MGIRPSRNAGPGGRVIVQLTLQAPDGTTKYVDQLVGSDEVEYRFSGWKNYLLGRYDVLHVHWPELMIRARSPLKRFLKRRALDVLLLKLWLLRIPLVRTVHNVRPHEEGDRAERRALDRIDRATSFYIVLNQLTPLPTKRPSALVPHGHYIERYSRHPAPDAIAGRVTYFGLIRPYKGVIELVDAFRAWDPQDASLRIVGKASHGMDTKIRAHAAGDERITSKFAFVDDDELVEEVGSAQLVVLPYKQMHNSGAILAALSIGRPVLVPGTPTMVEIREEVGDDWVMTFDGDLTAEVLARAAEWARSAPRAAAPDLSERDWDRVRALHTAAYRRSLGRLEAVVEREPAGRT